jgi:G:T-mismatch repair DNA endonuclease (very short patch repair protein)
MRGWKTLTVWECQTLEEGKLQERILDFLA